MNKRVTEDDAFDPHVFKCIVNAILLVTNQIKCPNYIPPLFSKIEAWVCVQYITKHRSYIHALVFWCLAFLLPTKQNIAEKCKKTLLGSRKTVWLKYQFWKNVTSEKWNSVGLNTFTTYLSSLLGVIAEYNSNHA